MLKLHLEIVTAVYQALQGLDLMSPMKHTKKKKEYFFVAAILLLVIATIREGSIPLSFLKCSN